MSRIAKNSIKIPQATSCIFNNNTLTVKGQHGEMTLNLNEKFDAAFVFSTHDEKVTKFIRREVGLEDGYVKWDKRRNGVGDFE